MAAVAQVLKRDVCIPQDGRVVEAVYIMIIVASTSKLNGRAYSIYLRKIIAIPTILHDFCRPSDRDISLARSFFMFWS